MNPRQASLGKLGQVEHGHTKGKLDAKLSEELANQKVHMLFESFFVSALPHAIAT